MLTHLLVGALALADARRAPLMKLRGGVSAEQAQQAIGYITLAQATVGHVFTKESMEMYEFKGEIEAPTLAFSKFNYALQIAHAVNLLMPEYGITALAVAIFASSSEFGASTKAPRMPAVAWAGTLLALQHFKDSVPAWLLPSLLIASGLHGTVAIEQAMDMYQIGVPLTKQSKTMAKFVNAGFVALGAYLLAPTLGYSSAQAFGAYGLVYTAFILKMATVDGGAELFNPAGAYVWAAIVCAWTERALPPLTHSCWSSYPKVVRTMPPYAVRGRRHRRAQGVRPLREQPADLLACRLVGEERPVRRVLWCRTRQETARREEKATPCAGGRVNTIDPDVCLC
jgi:hypothetical protein